MEKFSSNPFFFQINFFKLFFSRTHHLILCIVFKYRSSFNSRNQLLPLIIYYYCSFHFVSHNAKIIIRQLIINNANSHVNKRKLILTAGRFHDFCRNVVLFQVQSEFSYLVQMNRQMNFASFPTFIWIPRRKSTNHSFNYVFCLIF